MCDCAESNTIMCVDIRSGCGSSRCHKASQTQSNSYHWTSGTCCRLVHSPPTLCGVAHCLKSTQIISVFYLTQSIRVTRLLILTADGLALGAAAGLSKVDVQIIIFLAIMLHKVSHRSVNNTAEYTIPVIEYLYQCFS